MAPQAFGHGLSALTLSGLLRGASVERAGDAPAPEKLALLHDAFGKTSSLQ